MKAIVMMSLLMVISVSPAYAGELTTSPDGKMLAVNFGEPTFKQVLHYRKMYNKKPFPDAVVYYYSNGLYKIISQGENHYGVYILQGKFSDETYTVRSISLPSADWGNKTAYHQLTFIRGGAENVFIQNAIVETGEAIAQQNGTYTLEKNVVKNPVNTNWSNK